MGKSFRCVVMLALLAIVWAGQGKPAARARPFRVNAGDPPGALQEDQVQADLAIAVIRQDCGSYGGPHPCYGSLAAWEGDYGGIDFGLHAQGDLIAADKIAVARIEGTWTVPDTARLEISGWVTDPAHYVRIYTDGGARHNGVPGSGYRLAVTDPSGTPFYSNVAHLRVEGLEIHADSSYDGSVIYLRPDSPEGVGEIDFSHNLIHGNGIDSSSGILNYGCRGTVRIWNNIIYDVGEPGYTAGIQSSVGTAYLYNNTIVDIISGFGIRADGKVVVKNNLVEAPGYGFYGAFYPGSDFNASSDDTAPGFHSRREQSFVFVNRALDNFHLAPSDVGASNSGLDLSGDPYISILDDVDGVLRSGAWDIGADEQPAAPDDTPPVCFDGAPSGTLPSYTTEATVSLQTNEASTCRFAMIPDVPFSAMTGVLTSTEGLTHLYTATGLVDEQTYTYFVRCRDPLANTNMDDYVISFYIFSADAVPPVISEVGVFEVSPYSARVTWTTDEWCTSQVEYGEDSTYGRFTVLSTTLVTSHSMFLVGLDPSTTYHFRVRSRDVAENETVSADEEFTTAALGTFYHVDQKAANASDLNPGTETEPWLTIQHAADVAQPGDTILVHPGSYGRVRIEHGGAWGQFITFKGVTVPDQGLVDPDAQFDPAHPVQVPGNPELNAVTMGFDLDPPYLSPDLVRYVRIENFEVTAIYDGVVSGRGGIHLVGTENVQVVRNFLHDLNPNPAAYGYVGIRGETHDNVDIVVKGNTLYRVQGTGIGIFGRGWLVEDNELSHGLDANTDTGAHVGGDSDAIRFFGSGHVIRNNYLHDYLNEEQYGDPHIDAFQTFSVYPDSQFAHHILVEANYCSGFGQMLMIEDSSEGNGTGNKVHHITFRNNIFRGARAAAINGSRADHFTLVNNVFAYSHYSGFGLIDSPYLTVLNNIFFNDGGGSQIIDLDTKVGAVWDYNLHFPDFSWPPKQPEFDRHSLFGVNPVFVAPEQGDYHLRFESPAVERGTAISTFNYDHDGVVRPHGPAWDIGAYEVTRHLMLCGTPGNGAVSLSWWVNVTLPVSLTWEIDYDGPIGNQIPPVTGLLSPTRSYSLTGLTNYVWYTVTLSGLCDDATWLSDTIRVMPTDIAVYLPLLFR